MGSGITIFVPLKPFLVSYLETRYGESPISFSGKSIDEDKIMVKLSKLLRKAPPKPIFPDNEQSGITIDLTRLDDFDPRYYNYLSPHGYRLFAKYIYERVFLIHFYDWMDDVYDDNDEVRHMINEFCDKYNLLEKDIAHETMKRRYYRYRESRMNEIRQTTREKNSKKN